APVRTGPPCPPRPPRPRRCAAGTPPLPNPPPDGGLGDLEGLGRFRHGVEPGQRHRGPLLRGLGLSRERMPTGASLSAAADPACDAGSPPNRTLLTNPLLPESRRPSTRSRHLKGWGGFRGRRGRGGAPPRP